MKTRKGFVSNSSTSSFLCNFCGEVTAGYEEGLEDVDMFECRRGHTLCDHHAIDGVPESERYGADPEHCPICQMHHIMDEDLANYLLRQAGLSREEATKQIRREFDSFDQFSEYVRPIL